MSKIQSLQIAAARMPVLSLPAQMSVGKHGMVGFTLETAAGPVAVRGWLKTWDCQGSADALIAHGLLRPAWLPGVPGNNKILQRVCFGASGPRLLGRHERCESEACLSITRRSQKTYEVTLPATPEQIDVLDKLRDQQKASRRDEDIKVLEEQERIKRLQVPADEVRAEALHVADVAADVIMRRVESSAFRFDPATERQLREHYRQIAQLINDATLIPGDPVPRGGNVVRLRRGGARNEIT